jgi:hypothetical protein
LVELVPLALSEPDAVAVGASDVAEEVVELLEDGVLPPPQAVSSRTPADANKTGTKREIVLRAISLASLVPGLTKQRTHDPGVRLARSVNSSRDEG